MSQTGQDFMNNFHSFFCLPASLIQVDTPSLWSFSQAIPVIAKGVVIVIVHCHIRVTFRGREVAFKVSGRP
jgi:hypothetical protein